jgi:hypothetical protein|nr:MAG TPA: YopX protein [Caudoviricetes sp.]
MIPKFRGISIADDSKGKMQYGYLIADGEQAFIINEVVEANEQYITIGSWCPVDPKTIEQSTGLKDKNGKDIFEGDILKVANNDSSWFEVVKYDHDKAMFISKEVNLKYEVPETPLYDLFIPYLFKVEVIGNIWEDGDLIDGKKANEN